MWMKSSSFSYLCIICTLPSQQTATTAATRSQAASTKRVIWNWKSERRDCGKRAHFKNSLESPGRIWKMWTFNISSQQMNNNNGGGGCGVTRHSLRLSIPTRSQGSPLLFFVCLKTVLNDNDDGKINHKTINRVLVKWKEVGIIGMNDKQQQQQQQ